MSSIPKTLDDLIENLSKLPGIGKRTAERLGIFLLESDEQYLKSFSSAISGLNDNISECKICHCFLDIDENYEKDECMICNNISRDSKTICILKKASDVITFEKTGYDGHYHVLGNLISPIDGITEDDLNIESLLLRLNDNSQVSEIIIATDASIEGDATGLYLSDLLKEHPIRVTRLARGLPIGGTLDHIDQTTLTRSIEDRVELK